LSHLSPFQVHKVEKDFTCEICTLNFRHKNSLVRHMVQHSGDRPYSCQVCKGSFSCQRLLKDHMRKMHPTHADNICYNEPKKAIQPLHPPRSYAPIAPRSGPILQHPQQHPQMMQSQCLVPGPNGSMYLITNPSAAAPPQPQPQPAYSIQDLGNGLQVITQQPQTQMFHQTQQGLLQQQQGLLQPHQSLLQHPFLLQQQQQQLQQQQLQQLTINPYSTSLTPTSIGTPCSRASGGTPGLYSPTDSSMLMPPTPEVPTPEPSKEPLLDIPGELEMHSDDGSVTVVNSDSLTFEVVGERDSDGSADGSEMVYTTQTGEQVQVNILERAILEIPELNEGNFQDEEQQPHQLDQVPNPIMTSAFGGEEEEVSTKVGEVIGGEDEGIDKLEEQRQQRRQEEEDQRVMLQKQQERQKVETEVKKRMLLEDEERKRLIEENMRKEEQMRRRMKEEEDRKRMEDKVRRRIQEEAEVRRRMEEEKRKRMMEAEVEKRLRSEQQVKLQIVEEPAPKAKEVTTYDCKLCGRKYKFENFLKVHQRRPCV
jgi:hypothetical protein